MTTQAGKDRKEGPGPTGVLKVAMTKNYLILKDNYEVTKLRSGRQGLGRQQHTDTKSRRWEWEVERLQTVQRE